jgi:hypothetical protein
MPNNGPFTQTLPSAPSTSVGREQGGGTARERLARVVQSLDPRNVKRTNSVDEIRIVLLDPE